MVTDPQPQPQRKASIEKIRLYFSYVLMLAVFVCAMVSIERGTPWAKWLITAALTSYLWTSWMESRFYPDWNMANWIQVFRRTVAVIAVILQVTLEKPNMQKATAWGGIAYAVVWLLHYIAYLISKWWDAKYPDPPTGSSE